MITVTQNSAPGMSAVPVGAEAALPSDVAAITGKENAFWQVIALLDAAVIDTDASDPAKAGLASGSPANKPDQTDLNTDEIAPENAVLPTLAQFLIAPPIPVADSPLHNVTDAAPAPRAPGRPHATHFDPAVPDPITPMLAQATPAPDQPSSMADVKAELNNVLPPPSTTLTDLATPEPWQSKEAARPVPAQATAPANDHTDQASRLSDHPNTITRVTPDLRRPDVTFVKSDGHDHANKTVAANVSKPGGSQGAPGNTVRATPKPLDGTAPDMPAPSQHSDHSSKPDLPPSTVENAWRQKWIDTDQPAVRKDVATKVVAVGQQTATLAKASAFNHTTAEAAQPSSTELAATAASPAQATAVRETIPAPLTAKTTFVMPDADVSQQPADASTAHVAAAKLRENAMPDKPSLDAPGIGSALPPPSAAISIPTVQSTGVITSTIPPGLVPTIVEMTKSGNDGPLELALSPEELGRVTISIRQEGDFVRVTLAAERPETLDLLRRHAGDLVADLRQSGFSGASLSFGHGGQGQPARFAENPEDTSEQSPSQPPPPETRPLTPSRSSKGAGVDLRF